MRRPMLPALALASVLLLAACGGGETAATGGAGTVRILLTDAPFPYDSVESVHLYVESVAAATSADTTSPQGTHWQTIAEPRQRFDLLALQAGATAILGESELPAGQYKAVRIVLNTDSSRVLDRTGRAMDVQWQSSAGRVALHALVEDAVDASAGGSIVIDIDVGRSFVCPGDACGRALIFIPWFRAVNTAATGSVAGLVRVGAQSATAVPLPNATVTVMGTIGGGASEYVVATGATGSDGRYKVPFLRPGRYRVRVDPPRGTSAAPAVRDTVPVEIGVETASIDFRLVPGSTAAGQLVVSSSGPATIAVGDSVFFTAYVVGSGADSLSGAVVTWSSSNTSVLTTVSKGARLGAAVGVAPGSATVTASLPDGRSTSALMTVVPRREVAEVGLSLPRTTVAVGDSVIAIAAPRDASGQAVIGATATFAVSDTTVLAPRGVYSGVYFLGTAKKAGTATITATSNGRSSSGTVTVQ